MAAFSEEERRRKNGKELPPITLSNTSIPGLVTLIPILVSLTSQGQNPRFDDENDKPVWWPSDIQWQNPKSYSAYMGSNILKILRKVVHSCYSYHGVEDLLCRLDETSLTDAEEDNPMEPITLPEPHFIEDDGPASCSSSDGLVFVCCFCLEEFGSHEQVTAHQAVCRLRFQIHGDGGGSGDAAKSSNDSDSRDSPVKHLPPTPSPPPPPPPPKGRPPQLPKPGPKSAPKLTSGPPYPVSLHKTNGFSVASEKVPSSNEALSRASTTVSPLPPAAEKPSPGERLKSSSSLPSSRKPLRGGGGAPSSTTSTVKRRASAVQFAPTLKTRSQKKLDSIMEKHHSRKLMRSEWQRMKGVAERGAWWAGKRHRRRSGAPSDPHPSVTESQPSFLSQLGLTVKVKTEPADPTSNEVAEEKKSVLDLDCEIVLVEGPMSCQTSIPGDAGTHSSSSLSPRGSRSLISQLGRDSDAGGSRRRLSFCFVEDEWADKEALEEGRDPLQMSLLTIGLSSPLGQRIKKYFKAEGPPVTIIKDPEMYCKTEMKDDSYSRLRFRAADYRVTFRRKCRGSRFVHTYKFNRWDVAEFKTRLKTGLSARSRRLQWCMKPLRVLLRHLGEEEIKHWTEEKKVSITENIIYDDDICLTQIEIPESKVKGYLTPNVKPPAPPAQPNSSSKSAPHGQRPHSGSHHHHTHHHHNHHNHRHPHHRHNLPSHSPASRGPKFTHLSTQRSSPQALHPSLYLNHHSSSPPHVPNIFRNRNAPANANTNTGVLQPGPKSAGRAQFAQRPHPYKIGPAFYSRPNGGQQDRRSLPSKYHAPAATSSSSMAKSNLPKGDGVSSAGFSSGLIIHERRPMTPTASSGSRRKQALTQVRQDEQEVKGGPGRSQASIRHSKGTAGFVNLSSLSSSSRHRGGGPTSSSLSLPLSQSSSSSSSSSIPSSLSSSKWSSSSSARNNNNSISNAQHQPAHDPQQVPRLSNFEYLSIRQGLLSSGHSLGRDNGGSRGGTQIKKLCGTGGVGAVSNRPQQQQQQHRPSPRPTLNRFSSSSSSSSSPNLNSRGPPPVYHPSQQKRSSGSAAAPASANNRVVGNATRPPSHNTANQRVANHERHAQEQAPSPVGQLAKAKVGPVDDDVMEVICIDD